MKTKNLHADTISLLLLQGCRIGLGFALSIALARLLGTAEFGTYSYIIAWASLFAVVANRGLSELLVREVAVFKGEKQWPLLRGIISYGNRVSMGITLVACVGLSLLIWGGFRPLGTDNAMLPFLGLILAALLALNAHRQATLRGLGHTRVALVPEYAARPVLMLLLIGVSVVFAQPLQSESAITLYVLATFIALMIGAKLLSINLQKLDTGRDLQHHRQEWFSSSRHFLLIAGMLVINAQADKIMLGAMGFVDQVGLYSVAAQIASLAGMSLIAVNVAVSPSVVRYLKNGQLNDLQLLLTKSSRLALMTSSLMAVVLILLTPFMLSLFGSDFQLARFALWILITGQLINVLAGPCGTVLKMAGLERELSLIVALSALTNVILNLILIPQYSINGAAMATAASLLVWNILSIALLHRRCGLTTTSFVWSSAR